MRIYNPALGRFLSVDPLTMKYPELTPYQFPSNSPIQGIDWDGLELKTVTVSVGEHADGTTYIEKLKPNFSDDIED